LGKLVALVYLLITVQRGSITNNRERTRLYRMVEFIGRWSMLDVFVDTFTVALVQLQPLMSVEPGPGVVFFAAVVVLTMIAAASFDPRLILGAGVRASKERGHGWKHSSGQSTASLRGAEEGHAALNRVDRPALCRAGGDWHRSAPYPQRRADHYHRLHRCPRRRGWEDLHPVQGREHRPGVGGTAVR